MLKRNVFTDVMLKRFVRANRIPAVHPPLIPPLPKSGWQESGEALNAFERTENARVWFWKIPLAKAALFLLLAALTLSAQAGVREVGAIGLTVGDLNRELMFYTNTLPFELVSLSEVSGPEQAALLGLSHVKLRVANLKLGDERITLTEHLVNKGKPIPADSQSYDHWFQHIAIVVRDMDKAYEQLRSHKVKQVSTAPQTLPEWNKGAAGIKAFYFRDPEDHVLEIIFFPPGKGDPKWQSPSLRYGAPSLAGSETGGPLFLGIDHTAIVVSDTDKSLAFYRDLLGLRVAGESENYGVEQEHLNQVFGARLHITGLRAEHGPGIEFLEYITPPGGRALPSNAKANDLIFWDTHVAVEDAAKLSAKLHESCAAFVSKPGNARSQIVRDPDGHAIELDSTEKAAPQN
jgi:catechol 2,3-dioxygenase-like lactoylglutathione lyase family enzyme